MANKNDKFIEVFDVQAEVLSKISELKAQGYREEDMYVIAENDDQLSMVQGQTDVNLDSESSGDGSGDWADKFKSLFTGEDSTRGAFDRMNLSDSESDQYHQQLKNGKILLYVDSEYGSTFDNQTTSGTDTSHGTSSTGRTSGTDEESIRLHEERLNVDKERVQTGEVNVGKHVVEEEQTIEVPVEREEVYVERRPVNEETTSTSGGLSGKDAYQDDDNNIRIPVSEERIDVSKKEVVGEEIVVGKKKVKDTEHVSETVRREEADIDENVNNKKSGLDNRDNKDRF